jgi:cytoskeletal protein CcmA (bactofilin family)
MRGAIFRLFAILILVTSGTAAQAQSSGDIAGQALEWASGGDVFSVARDLTIDRTVDGTLSAAGEVVILTRDAEVKGDTWIAARRAAVEGDLDGDLSIRAQEALINGKVKGDVAFYGLDLTLGPDADIGGNVTYYSPSTARVDRNARVKGEINGHDIATAREQSPPSAPRADMRDRWRDRHMNEYWDGPRISAPGYHMSASGALFFGVIALVIAFAMPVTTTRMRDALVAQPVPALGLGLIWLVGLPVAAVLIAITIVGLPFAFLLLLLWPLGMILGLAGTLAAFGEFLAGRIGEAGKGALGRVAGIVLAAAIIWIGISVPFLGALVWLFAVAGGIGLLYLGLRQTPL